MSMSRAEIEEIYGSDGAYWRGDEFFTKSPFRFDTHVGSFSINAKTGCYYDFATGDKGNIFEGKKEVSNYLTEADVEWLRSSTSDLEYLTPYRNKEGKIIFVVIRKRGKIIYPLSRKDGKLSKGLPEDIKAGTALRPTTSLDYPGKGIVIVEGEKCYHEARMYFSRNGYRLNVVTWHGGCNVVHKVDWSTVIENSYDKVVIWPDNDQSGIMAMEYIRDMLRKAGKTIGWVVAPKGKEQGWDIADAIAGNEDVVTYIRESFLNDYEQKYRETPQEVAKKTYPYTDLGNAERFADMWRGKVKYNQSRNRWMVWSGKVWEENPEKLQACVKATIADIQEEYMENGAKIEARRSIENMLALAQAEPDMRCKESDFDTDRYKINCRNGVVDLKTGKLLPHESKYMFTKIVDVDYNPHARCPKFMQFLKEIMKNRIELVNFLQRWFGIGLSADVSVQKFVIFYGSGANGKSTLINIIQEIMDEFSKTAPSDILIDNQRSGGVPNDIASLCGSRLVFAAETEMNAKLAESKIKSITGGDIVVARYLYGEYFQFKPTWKIILSTNHKPRITGTDNGIWRRIILVPFEYTVPNGQINPNLVDELLEEREGIFTWMVDGAMDYFMEGRLSIPSYIESQTKEYQVGEDAVKDFLEETCHIDNPAMPDKVQLTKLHKIFLRWADQSNNTAYKKTSLQGFARILQDRGHKVVKEGSKRFVLGVYPTSEYLED